MREFKKRRSRGEEFLSVVVRAVAVLVLLLVTGVVVHGAWDIYGKLAVASEGQEAAQVQLSALQAQQAQVETSLAELSSQRGVETQVRERFGVARPGEGVIQIVHDEETTTPQETPSENIVQRIFRALFVW